MNDRVEASYPLSGEPFAKGRVVTIAAETRRRPIVLVVGAPRSGMSLCAHIVSAMGIDMADEISAQPSNLRDRWERWEIGEFHDRILRLFNRAYFGPFHDLALPVAWWADPRVCQIRREIVAFLQERIGDSYFGFKDPRTVRLMPIWHHILNDLNLESKVVLCLRDPSQVARSLKARDGVDHEIGEYRWLTYMIDFFRYTNGFDICTIEYEGWLKDPLANFEKLRKFLDRRWQQNEFDLDLMLSGIIDPALNHHGDSDYRRTNHSLVCSLYELASRPELDGATRERISDAVSGFINFQQLQRPVQQAFEDIAEVASKFPELEKGAASLRAALSERDQSVEAANSRAGLAEVRVTELEQEAASLRAALSERDQSVEAANSRAGVAEVRVAELEQGVEAQRAHLAEIVRDCADRAAFEGAVAASASSPSAFADIESAASALQATLMEREAALAEASHQADGRRGTPIGAKGSVYARGGSPASRAASAGARRPGGGDAGRDRGAAKRACRSSGGGESGGRRAADRTRIGAAAAAEGGLLSADTAAVRLPDIARQSRGRVSVIDTGRPAVDGVLDDRLVHDACAPRADTRVPGSAAWCRP
jgi:hypothetical protein